MTVTEFEACQLRFDAEAIRGEVATPRYSMKYFDWGTGSPLVIVHGLNDVARSFAPLMLRLSESFRCIAIRLPDGEDDGAKLVTYRHADYPLDVIALLDHLQLERVDILGSSFGSTIALRTAATFPERIRRIVLQGGFARRPLNAVESGLARLGRSWPWRMGSLPLRPRIMRKLEAPAFVNAPAMIEFLPANSAITPIRAATQRARILETLDLRPLLPKIIQPILMIGGDRDRIVPRIYEAEVEAGAANVKRIEFANCGHSPQYTHSEEMAAAVKEFLI